MEIFFLGQTLEDVSRRSRYGRLFDLVGAVETFFIYIYGQVAKGLNLYGGRPL